ncbi:hypothetical protein J3E72DRAFT_400906, partial [Bipolaris maydis]|uniref:uncharacterized protein n=1 Tax=Cochliobolus heterostrophus TaxID=5016 RepID=UPI0024D2B25B
MNEESDYDRIVELTGQKEALERHYAVLKDELTKAESSLRAANDELKRSTDALDIEKNKSKGLHTLIKKLEKDIDHEKAATKDAEERVEELYSDLNQSRFAHRSALIDRDEALADHRDLKLQLEDLKEQWQESEERIAALEADLEEAQKAVYHAQDIEHDITSLREQIGEQERTIIIKDERISHLEMQVQKERQRIYHTADAIARENAASPVDEDQHIGAIGDSLASELSAIDDAEFYEIEWNDYSHIQETPLTYEPIAPSVPPPSTIHSQESVSISPVAAHVPRLTLDVREAGRLEPREPALDSHFTVSIIEGTSTEPVAATVSKHTLIMRETASTGPIEPARAPLSSMYTSEVASFAPRGPARVAPSSLNQHEIVSIAPQKPGVATLTVSVREAGSTIPTVRRISTTNCSAQTDVARLTTEFAGYASVSTTPSTPVRVATAESPAQTDSPVLRNELVDYATVSTIPIAAVEAVAAEPVASTLSGPHPVLDIAPVAPTVVERKFASSVTKGTQTVPESPTAGTPNECVSVVTTHEVQPENIVVRVKPKVLMLSMGVQTIAETASVVDDREEVERRAPQPLPATVPKTTLEAVMDWVPTVLNLALVVFCLYLYMRLNAWQRANGVGVGGGRGNSATRSGAYGNGRRLFGIFPVGMNEGESWWSEKIARHTSSAVSRFEDWAGLAYEPLY